MLAPVHVPPGPIFDTHMVPLQNAVEMQLVSLLAQSVPHTWPVHLKLPQGVPIAAWQFPLPSQVAAANCVEKVHRAAVALEWLDRLSPGLPQSKPGAAGLGVPVP